MNMVFTFETICHAILADVITRVVFRPLKTVFGSCARCAQDLEV